MTEDTETLKQRRERALVRALDGAAKDAELSIGPVELTKDDIRNGWTEESLRAYLVDQQASQAQRINPTGVMRRKPMPRLANSKYRPHGWHGRGR